MLLPTVMKTNACTIKLKPRRRVDADRWVWPLPALATTKPRIVGRANDERMAVDVGYDAPDVTSRLVPVYAVQDGIIQLARETVSGFAMVVDHHGEWSSYYARLRQMMFSPTWDDARPKMRVRPGQIIGYAASDAPIRFELWRWTHDAGFVPTEPELQMTTWQVLSEPGLHLTAQPLTKTAAA